MTARVLVDAYRACCTIRGDGVACGPPAHVRLDKGSHIVVLRLFDHDRGYVFQTRDRRVVFALPFARYFTLIGTTDQSFSVDPAAVPPARTRWPIYARRRTAISRGDPAGTGGAVIRGRARALRRRLQDVAGYPARLRARARRGIRRAPLLTVYGGKITTYRRSRSRPSIVLRISRAAGRPGPWARIYRAANFPRRARSARGNATREVVAVPRRAHARRLVRAYGTRVRHVLGSPRGSTISACRSAPI